MRIEHESPPFHGGNTGSSPVGRANDFKGLAEGTALNDWRGKVLGNKCGRTVTNNPARRELARSAALKPEELNPLAKVPGRQTAPC